MADASGGDELPRLAPQWARKAAARKEAPCANGGPPASSLTAGLREAAAAVAQSASHSALARGGRGEPLRAASGRAAEDRPAGAWGHGEAWSSGRGFGGRGAGPLTTSRERGDRLGEDRFPPRDSSSSWARLERGPGSGGAGSKGRANGASALLEPRTSEGGSGTAHPAGAVGGAGSGGGSSSSSSFRHHSPHASSRGPRTSCCGSGPADERASWRDRGEPGERLAAPAGAGSSRTSKPTGLSALDFPSLAAAAPEPSPQGAAGRPGSPSAYTPSVAPHKQDFLASRASVGWTSKLADVRTGGSNEQTAGSGSPGGEAARSSTAGSGSWTEAKAPAHAGSTTTSSSGGEPARPSANGSSSGSGSIARLRPKLQLQLGPLDKAPDAKPADKPATDKPAWGSAAAAAAAPTAPAPAPAKPSAGLLAAPGVPSVAAVVAGTAAAAAGGPLNAAQPAAQTAAAGSGAPTRGAAAPSLADTLRQAAAAASAAAAAAHEAPARRPAKPLVPLVPGSKAGGAAGGTGKGGTGAPGRGAKAAGGKPGEPHGVTRAPGVRAPPPPPLSGAAAAGLASPGGHAPLVSLGVVHGNTLSSAPPADTAGLAAPATEAAGGSDKAQAQGGRDRAGLLDVLRRSKGGASSAGGDAPQALPAQQQQRSAGDDVQPEDQDRGQAQAQGQGPGAVRQPLSHSIADLPDTLPSDSASSRSSSHAGEAGAGRGLGHAPAAPPARAPLLAQPQPPQQQQGGSPGSSLAWELPEEEEAFLRSLGWTSASEEDEEHWELTPDEIAGYQAAAAARAAAAAAAQAPAAAQGGKAAPRAGAAAAAGGGLWAVRGGAYGSPAKPGSAALGGLGGYGPGAFGGLLGAHQAAGFGPALLGHAAGGGGACGLLFGGVVQPAAPDVLGLAGYGGPDSSSSSDDE